MAKFQLQQSANSIFMISVREAFIALLPFLLLMSLFALASSLCSYAVGNTELSQLMARLASGVAITFPAIAAVSIGIHFSRNLDVPVITVISITFIAIAILSVGDQNLDASALLSRVVNDPRALLTMMFTPYVVKAVEQKNWFFRFSNVVIGEHLKRNLNVIGPAIISLVIVTLVLAAVSSAFLWLMTPLLGQIDQMNPFSIATLRIFFINLFWMFGLHGANTFHLLIEQSASAHIDFYSYELAPNLSMALFGDLFANFGGGGATWSLIIAILLFSKDPHSRKIAILATPFAIFNVNEILIFALPLAFNPKYFLPFVCIPVLNALLSSVAISSGWFQFVDYNHSWILPGIVNMFMATDGDSFAIMFQVTLIWMGIYFYKPFVISADQNVKIHQAESVLYQKLSIKHEMERVTEKTQFERHARKIEASLQLLRAIEDVNRGELLLHYQPKVDIVSGQVVGVEALLRLRTLDDKIHGPYFLESLQSGGYSRVIDYWVISEVSKTLSDWQRKGFMTNVSINLDPNNLLSAEFVTHLKQQLARFGQFVELELLESRYMERASEIDTVLEDVKTFGFKVSIDDFGTGFSCLSVLSKIGAHTIKIDKSLLDNADNNKGAVLYQQICHMCNNLGFKLVAEGVETQAQVDFVRRHGVTVVQGWHFSKAMPAKAIPDYAQKNSV